MFANSSLVPLVLLSGGLVHLNFLRNWIVLVGQLPVGSPPVSFLLASTRRRAAVLAMFICSTVSLLSKLLSGSWRPKIAAERWQSGRLRRSWKPLSWKAPGVRIPFSPLASKRIWVGRLDLFRSFVSDKSLYVRLRGRSSSLRQKLWPLLLPSQEVCLSIFLLLRPYSVSICYVHARIS